MGDKEIYSTPYKEEKGQLMGIGFTFSGIGEVSEVILNK